GTIMADASQLGYGPLLVAVGGLVLNGVCILASSIFQRGKRDADLSSIQSWASTHQKEADARDMQISELSRIAAASEATAKAMKESLQEMREELRDIRNRDLGWRQSVAGAAGDHPMKRGRL